MPDVQGGPAALGAGVDIRYIPLLWRSLEDNRMDGHPTPLIVSVTNEELKALLAVDHGALDNILKNKIRPTFLQQQKHGWPCSPHPIRYPGVNIRVNVRRL